MPEQDGYETTRILKNDFGTNHIPIILLTACDTDEQKLKGLENGADDYITKPFNLKYLIKRINNLVEQRKKLKVKFETKEEVTPVADNSNYEEDQKPFSEFNEIILQNISNPTFNIDLLANLMGLSRSVIFRKIKNITGYPPNEYLKQMRTKKAEKLLTTTSKTITEISNEVGIPDSNYFSKVFKSHFGSTPSIYRKQNSKL